MLSSVKEKFLIFFNAQRHIAPLAVLRMAFGSIMLVSVVRFLLKGWVNAFYIKPKLHFTFYGFDWVRPLGALGMYALFALLIVTALMVTIGLLYKIAITSFFLCFTYVELIDKTTYLNHYYFISIMAFLMILVPANRYFSVDVWRKPNLKATMVPGWCIGVFQVQLIIVYFFAGISKLNHDWLIAAMPLRIWLPANSQLLLIGGLLTHLWVAYVFSWFGAIFDLLIGFLLLAPRTRKAAYFFVVVFHLFTAWFFKIGMFPYIMIFVTIIFFSENTHLRIIAFIKKIFRITGTDTSQQVYHVAVPKARLIYTLLVVHFIIQLVLPFRYLLYPGKLYWTEEGYRFSWRVMLMEKGGTAFFHVKDPATGHKTEIINSQYLTPFQEAQMSTQPDMILQFAHFLAQEYQNKGIKDPIVTAESYVTLNGSGSRLYIDSTVNLAKEEDSFGHKKWILPFHHQAQ
ncbi:HTTM domain-containing protein [Mucilaginibacter sabulilitoris]|uniref:HTTM domain-containing protein n=1 Tax=Mucilaginibacter sabulilitoris TaxID=1173583 RepID=A0ABZ0TT28_9SPHI|nr:HTTM domain-containing protein [Mucilaginibacter sabulilitoris]WPU95318.1 HTTM domain-containing protein [Mucilaginibacter sabulilitoris]